MPDDSKAIAHLKVMQKRMGHYLAPGAYTDLDGKTAPENTDYEALAFIRDICHLLDGPEQREAMAGEPVKLDCTAMFDRLDPL